MREGTFVAMTVAELKKEIKEHYKKVLVDNVAEILDKGNTLVPASILDGGIAALELDELVEASQDWFDEEHSDADVIMLYDEKGKELTVIKHPYNEEGDEESVKETSLSPEEKQ